MNFDEAEARFRELQARVQRGEPISRAEYEDQVAQLAVQDDRGVLWEINPRTGKWMYFDGAEWIGGNPPGRAQSDVTPMPRAPAPPAMPPTRPPSTPPMGQSPRPFSMSQPSQPSPMRSTPPLPSVPRVPPPGRAAAPPRPAGPASPDSIQPYVRVNAEEPPGAPPPGAGQGVPTGGPLPPRLLRPTGPLGGPNREWVPLAIGAVVLLFCAVLLFFGGRAALGILGGPSPTATRVAVVSPPTIPPVPTAIRLPTAVLPTSPAGSSTVIAKVIERSVNVRAAPNTKAKVLSTLKQNNQITLIGRNDAGDWYQIKLAGSAGLGWVFGETLQITSGDPNSLPIGTESAAPAATSKPTTRATAAAPRGTATLTPIGGRPTP